jgi:hypothetical protein
MDRLKYFWNRLIHSQYIMNMAISKVASSMIPTINILLETNVSLTLLPTFGFGTGGFGVVANVGLNYSFSSINSKSI